MPATSPPRHSHLSAPCVHPAQPAPPEAAAPHLSACVPAVVAPVPKAARPAAVGCQHAAETTAEAEHQLQAMGPQMLAASVAPLAWAAAAAAAAVLPLPSQAPRPAAAAGAPLGAPSAAGTCCHGGRLWLRPAAAAVTASAGWPAASPAPAAPPEPSLAAPAVPPPAGPPHSACAAAHARRRRVQRAPAGGKLDGELSAAPCTTSGCRCTQALANLTLARRAA